MRHGVQQFLAECLQGSAVTIVRGERKLRREALALPERRPGRICCVRLSRKADEIVAMPAEARAAVLVQLRKLPAERAKPSVGTRTEREILEDKERLTFRSALRDRLRNPYPRSCKR